MKTEVKREGFNERGLLAAVKIILACATVVVSITVLATSAPTLSNFGGKINRYLFVIGLSAVFMIEMLLPSIVEKTLKIKISPVISFVFIIHCFSGTFLGNVANMFHIIPEFDKIMHFLLGINTGMLGLALIQFFYPGKGGIISPAATAVFVFFTAIAIGACWEVLEFSTDLLFNLNMQRYALETGEYFVGQAALMDTMEDIVLDIAGAVAAAIPTYISLKHGMKWHEYCTVTGRGEDTVSDKYMAIH